MSEVPQRITSLLRAAIWEAHGRKCAYEGCPITWDQLEIDHIIPQSVWRDITKKRQVFEDLGLDEDFSPHDIRALEDAEKQVAKRKEERK
jgi:hypothetical protein